MKTVVATSLAAAAATCCCARCSVAMVRRPSRTFSPTSRPRPCVVTPTPNSRLSRRPCASKAPACVGAARAGGASGEDFARRKLDVARFGVAWLLPDAQAHWERATRPDQHHLPLL